MEKSKYLLVNENNKTYLGFFELSPQEAGLVEEIINCLCSVCLYSELDEVCLLNLDKERYFNPEKGE